ncbi:PKD domain-containing protein [Flammeovirga kamogawensis]|uniref:PKD domain-containing protein n=1 Tax=Flammeovirga kamogawensis TaxID=373891 RepID=A0ABX8H3C4_9BACT|nr:PKD domain-containing protein [Flammeovirga kamogawensis]MBB6461991.1 PKD repeat protein [Flammeovirga kamogawensis]QWG10405.1 PKD domain-containing protein [Flammeovirga kamogawensis]TRX63915.1 PKD domain-containing protein [Flammeovirga kamogawensis]
MKRITNILSATTLSLLSLLTIEMKTIQLLLFILFLTNIKTTAQNIYPHTDPNNKGGWLLKEDVSDEFDESTLDDSKWWVQGQPLNGGTFYANNFKGRRPSQFVPHAVKVEDGYLFITTRWEPDFDFLDEPKNGEIYENITTGAIISKKTFQYGYMEIRCKVADAPLSSAFWSTGDTNTDSGDNGRNSGELDVFEHIGSSTKDPDVEYLYHTSFHDWRLPSNRPDYGLTCWDNQHRLDFKVAEDYHIWAAEWGEDYIKIYVDDKMIRCVTKAEIGEENWVMYGSQKVWVDNEVFPWKGIPTEDELKDEKCQFIVDYVRVWQKETPMVYQGCALEDNLVNNPSFEDGLEGWTVTDNDVTVINNTEESYDATQHVKFENGKSTTLSQEITVKPNTLYILSAYALSPNTNGLDKWDNAWLGIEKENGDKVEVKYFRNFWNRKSLQFTAEESTSKIKIFFTNANVGANAKEILLDQIELRETPPLFVEEIVPIADFSMEINSGNGVVQFKDQSEGVITTWEWDFGDSHSSTQQHPLHTFEEVGDYTIRLVVKNNGGSSSISKVITITENNTIEEQLSADFTIAKDTVFVNESITFKDTSIGDISSWKWEFGDDNEATSQNPSHSYNKEGTYIVQLTINNTSGTANTTKLITVISKDKPEIPTSITPFLERKVNIFPNPSTGNFFVELENWSTDIKMSVIDQNGKISYQKEFNSTQVNLVTDFKKGIYFIRLESKDFIITKKLIIL